MLLKQINYILKKMTDSDLYVLGNSIRLAF